jgi:hypothetical protein
MMLRFLAEQLQWTVLHLTEVSVHAIITERKVTSTEKSIANIFVFIYKWFRRFSLDKVSNCIEKDGDTFPNRNV